MSSLIVSVALTLALGSAGQCPNCGANHHGLSGGGGRIMPDGPGYGWGFPNGNPDGYGWVDFGTNLPLGANRTSEYFFPRYFSVYPEQAFLPTYYNPYFSRGQRYVPYAGDGGEHPMGYPTVASAALPTNPYNNTLSTGPKAPVPPFSGRVEAPAVSTGASGLTP